VTLTGVHILRIADGRIAEHWGTNDDLGLMRQLGVIRSPETAIVR
jgi:predicted ester cyclase